MDFFIVFASSLWTYLGAIDLMCYLFTTTEWWSQAVFKKTFSQIYLCLDKCNKLDFKKVNIEGTEIEGASFTITGPSYNVTKTIGHDTIEKLGVGTYTIKETTAPTGYNKDETEITVVVSNNGEISINSASNIYERSTSATRNASLSIKNTLEEQPACYQNKTSKEYVWGKYKDNNSYDLVADITEEDKCKLPKCYYNPNTDDYKWDIEPPTDDYQPVDAITVEENCVKVEIDACYKNKTTGEYVFGKYETNNAYELVPNTDKDDCHEEIDNVPKTDYNINSLIIITMVLFSLFGFGFVVYSNYLKNHHE